MNYHNLVKITIDAASLIKIIINVIVRHHSFCKLIVSDRGSLLIPKFWPLLCYFSGMKQKLSTIFYPQTHSWNKKQHSTMKVYQHTLVNGQQNNWAKLLPIAEFTYNNIKNMSTGHTSFKLDCSYHPHVSFENKINTHLKFSLANILVQELRELMLICKQNLLYIPEL